MVEMATHVDVAAVEGPQLEELVALAWYYPEGYPPFGMHAVWLNDGVCWVFRDGIGEFPFAPLIDDEVAGPILLHASRFCGIMYSRCGDLLWTATCIFPATA